ncbi:hypothetical protein JCM24511_03691 [Saitozyma sp. JCM 24511]|nr:hypothetical protein JCM24511_03691 [Saitozyma sp. JCM 24511]
MTRMLSTPPVQGPGPGNRAITNANVSMVEDRSDKWTLGTKTKPSRVSTMLMTLAGVVAVAASVAFAETVTSSNGVTFSCATTEQSVQAHAPLCPTSLQDGTALNGKDLQLGYLDAPTNYQSTLVNRIHLYCLYTTGTCIYDGGLGVDTYSGGKCYPTTAGGGVNPTPSGGGHYKKRSSASDLASYPRGRVTLLPALGNVSLFYLSSKPKAKSQAGGVPPYVCPLQSTSTSETPFLGLQELTYYLSPLQLSLACTYYGDINRYTSFSCVYDLTASPESKMYSYCIAPADCDRCLQTGQYSYSKFGNSAGCPTTACTAPPMDGTGPLRKRHNEHIDKRQVDTAALRRRGAGGARAHVGRAAANPARSVD